MPAPPPPPAIPPPPVVPPPRRGAMSNVGVAPNHDRFYYYLDKATTWDASEWLRLLAEHLSEDNINKLKVILVEHAQMPEHKQVLSMEAQQLDQAIGGAGSEEDDGAHPGKSPGPTEAPPPAVMDKRKRVRGKAAASAKKHATRRLLLKKFLRCFVCRTGTLCRNKVSY